MKTSVSAKRCPECGKAAMLQAACCAVCGHQFRTRFVEPPVERTEAFLLRVMPPPAPLPRPSIRRRAGGAWTFQAAFLSGFLMVLLAGGLLWLVWSGWPPPGSGEAPLLPAAAPASQAVRLFQSIQPMMSLYDLDRAAGGMGRVVRSSDPHRLLLCYDYPPQSVCVSLSRADVSGGDYQVQDVSLYRGKTRLQHHSGIE